MIRQVQKKVLRFFAFIDRPAAWFLMIAGFVTFVGVLFNLILVGDFKVATLLIAADLTVAGFSAVQEAEDDEEVP